MNELQTIVQREVLGREFKMYGDFDNPLFLAKDVAEWIEHSDASKMLISVDESEKLIRTLFVSGQNRDAWFLTEDGLYEVLMLSRKPIAKEFKREVKAILRTIRKTGKYEAPKPEPKQPKLGELNSAARIIRQTLKEAGTAPEFIAVSIKGIYETAGINLTLNGITLPKHFYEVTEIANRLGVMSKSGKPHGQAISAIIAQIDVIGDETVVVPFHSLASGHAGTHTQYSQSVVSRIEQWIKQHDYPTPIFLLGKTFKVTYTKRI